MSGVLDVLECVINVLPQADVASLAQCNSKLYHMCAKRLYSNLLIRPLARLGNDHPQWSVVGGSPSTAYMSDEEDANVFVSRQAKLLRSFKENSELAKLVRRCAVFEDANTNAELVEWMKSNAGELEDFKLVGESTLLRLWGESQFAKLPKLRKCQVSCLRDIQYLPDSVKSLSIGFLRSFKEEDEQTIDRKLCCAKLMKLRELELSADEVSSLDFLKWFLDEVAVYNETALMQLRRLKVIFYHGFAHYNISLQKMVSQFMFKHCDLSKLRRLELIMGCDKIGCDCLTQFVDSLAQNEGNKLTRLHELAVIERTCHIDHNFTENFDVNVCRLLMNLPHVERHLRRLSIRHTPPLDGMLTNGFEGNYIRRRTLYEKTLPLLKSLQVLSSPSFMQTCSCYEVLPSDLLWNGCECEYCAGVLPLFDEFIMHHSYFNKSTGLVKDVISPTFFGNASSYMASRSLSIQDIHNGASDLDLWEYPLKAAYWDFHALSSISCFPGYECHFDKSVFESLCRATSHFFEDYVLFCMEHMPSLQTVSFSSMHFNQI